MNITEERNRFTLCLILIALIAAVPRLVLGASQFIEYDGYWHVFIAQQDNWHNFWRDIKVNAHPPLFFLLLKFLLHFGRSLLIYRAISLVTGVASVLSVGWIARRIVRSDLWAYACAMAYGFALPGIVMSCEVRSYMLSTFFILLSFAWLLDLVATPAAPRRPASELRLRTGFAIAAILACLSHYYAFFYVGAAAVLLLAWCLMRVYAGERVRWKAEAATILPVLGVIVVLYQTHAGALAEIQNHLRTYYYDPALHESIPSFLLRNWKNLMNQFLPYPISSDATALIILVLGIAAGFGLVRGFLRNRDAIAMRAAATILMTAGILGEIAIAAIAGKYPFGGDLRQQFILFPFFVLSTAILADTLAALIPVRARLVAAAAVALSIVSISARQFEAYPKISENVLQSSMESFNQLEPEPTAVYLDQFNLITFFTFHHDWQWSSLKQQPLPDITIYRLTRGRRQMMVFRDEADWNVTPDDAGVYRKLAGCLRAAKISAVSVFGTLQSPPAQPFSNFKAMRRAIASRAADSAICPQRLTLNASGWYGTFRESGCTALDLKPPRKTGAFDDISEEIEYSSGWIHGSFNTVADGTLSFSKTAGSTAQLSFNGTEITWSYPKAWNRGIGSVKIDGVPKGDFDLYSPKIIWQVSTTFSGLAPGKHMFELTVTGRKDAAATDRYIDIDSLVVR